MTRKGRQGPIVVLLILALLASGLARYSSQKLRKQETGMLRGDVSTGSSLGSMNSYALALLLGGMRGPLVMMLWQQSETQKQERNLEGLDTTIEWIRLLQPEYDTVHLFQVWNKAYNISVLMASLRNKYTTILDALDYAHKIDQARPDNINTLSQIGRIYFDKFGNSQERLYYRKQIRDESMAYKYWPTGKSRQRLDRNDPAWRRLDLDPILDENFRILPELTKPRIATAPTTRPVYDGSELGPLKRYEPFPTGVSPFALSYSYSKRAQLLERDYQQRHAQLSELVIDSGPALSLKFWAAEEWETGRRLEISSLGLVPSKEKLELESPTSNLTMDRTVSDAKSLAQAVIYYDRASAVAKDAIEEYNDHLREYRENYSKLQYEKADLALTHALMAADRDYLKAFLASGDERKSLLAAAREEYHQAVRQAAFIILRWYVDEDVRNTFQGTYPSNETIQSLPDQTLDMLLRATRDRTAQLRGKDYNNEDRGEFEIYLMRAIQRMELSGK